MTSLADKQFKSLVIIAGVLVAAVMMVCQTSLQVKPQASADTPVPFGSAVYEMVLKQPTGWLFSRN